MSLLVAGSLHLDVVLRAPHFPGLDETVSGSSVDYVFGGKGGNQAVSAARMGAEVHFAGRTGSDLFGDMIRETLDSSGVGLSQLQHEDGPSGMSAAIVDSNGEYGAVIVSAANLNIVAHEVDVPEGTSLVILQNEIPGEVNLEVALKAKAIGAKVWLNAAPARKISNDLVEAIDLLIVNKVEAEFYARLGFAVNLLKTLGADGVSYEGVQYSGFPVDVVSTHGAGDMFVGALASQVVYGTNMVGAIKFAQAAAALHVSSQLAKRKKLNNQAVTTFLAAQDKR
ncbi:MAG TPA: ribokinase [Rhodobacteraceae bacterium]|nr:ribokinase [Paracoccaceae bacterium]|tara:strand:+ start:642 stop:1487 length:846 start_codon:yes stop_codon:yes gene_type:complete